MDQLCCFRPSIEANSASLSLYGVLAPFETYPWLGVWILRRVIPADLQICPSMSMTCHRTVLMFARTGHLQNRLSWRESTFHSGGQ